VKGLSAFPREIWPPVRRVHLAFQAMVALGTTLAALSVAGLVLALRRRLWPRAYLCALAVAGPFGFLALEAGWLVTEWGRQPFAVHGVLSVAESVTPVAGLGLPLALFTAVYLLLGAVTAVLLWRQIAASPGGAPAGGAR
jgi:cytochrome d ubiquinol oxidase subunit I